MIPRAQGDAFAAASVTHELTEGCLAGGTGGGVGGFVESVCAESRPGMGKLQPVKLSNPAAELEEKILIVSKSKM